VNEFKKIGKYEVVDKIGQGSFGTVYKGRDPDLKRDVAIKVCGVEDEGLRRRFYREAEISGNLQHKNIVTVFNFGLEGEVPYLVQEYLSGEDLDEVIKRRRPIPTAEKLRQLIQVSNGLAYAHSQGVIHRDIKPGNVRLLEDGEVKILDFGIAKLASAETQLTQKGVTLGTASYLPPEQVRGGELDQRADIFSLGVLAYELLTYERPFKGSTLSALVYQILYKIPMPMTSVWPDCPEELSDVVARCLEKKPAHRFDDCQEVAAAFEKVLEGIESGRWPALQEAPDAVPESEAEADQSGEGEVMSHSMISRLAEAQKAGGRAPGSGGGEPELLKTRVTPIVDLESTQPVKAIPSAEAREDSGEDGDATAPTGEAMDVAPTLEMPTAELDGEDEGLLKSRAQEIGDLIAQGDLNQAMKELEETLSRQRDSSLTDTGTGAGTGTGSAGGKAPPPPPPLPAGERGTASGVEIDPTALTQPLETGGPPGSPPPPQVRARKEAARPGKEAPAAAPPRTASRLPRPTGKNWLLFGGLGALVLLVLIVGSLLIFSGGGDREEAATPEVNAPPPPATPPPAVEKEIAGLAIDAVPRAEVTEVVDLQGYVQNLEAPATTPLYLELSPGFYTVTLRHPDHEDLLECQVEVILGEIASCEVEFGPVDSTLYFKESGWWQ